MPMLKNDDDLKRARKHLNFTEDSLLDLRDKMKEKNPLRYKGIAREYLNDIRMVQGRIYEYLDGLVDD